ncbi:MAG: hypothetical protein NZ826_05860, partial [Thermodesulfovibrio sp.]|nr:hypothetical protein [Thermodesulfovibrio sp.]
ETYEVIKRPDEVFVEKNKGEVFFIFRRGDRIVVSSDDHLAIRTFFKLNRTFENWLKGAKRDGLIRIL